MFGTLGGPELFLILVVALIVFGPRKLPEIGKSLGRMMAEFRKASNEFKRTIEYEVEADKIRESMQIELPRLHELSSSVPASPAGTDVTSPAEPTPVPESSSEPEPATVSRDPSPPPSEPK
ncbi:MAG TPA: twin-arginine translocase TatA/TatE family subunit, partial [Vicinamibacteria bacterium]